MRELSFRRASSGLFSISKQALEVMEGYRQKDATQHEAGGILLGRVLLVDDRVIVDRAEPPGSEDRRSRLRFVRCRRRAQRTVDVAWRETGGTGNYLGEWHTHPEADPSPSRVDLENWRHILSRTRSELPTLFFVIVGTGSIRVWEGILGCEGVTPLQDASSG